MANNAWTEGAVMELIWEIHMAPVALEEIANAIGVWGPGGVPYPILSRTPQEEADRAR